MFRLCTSWSHIIRDRYMSMATMDGILMRVQFFSNPPTSLGVRLWPPRPNVPYINGAGKISINHRKLLSPESLYRFRHVELETSSQYINAQEERRNTIVFGDVNFKNKTVPLQFNQTMSYKMFVSWISLLLSVSNSVSI